MENYNWPLIGHKHIKDYFNKAFASAKIHHAYLFEGPAQVGKATFARLLAKTLLCEGDRNIPCGICRSCGALERNCHPDFALLERVEGGEHIQIEQAREFITSLSTKPLLGSTRIGMIEQASRLTNEAASALLKTIEEPGSSVVLFLISHKDVLPTIASRCQRIRFGFVPEKEISKWLGDIEHRDEIARFSNGCPGKAIAFKDKSAYKSYLADIDDISNMLGKDEGEQVLWISKRFEGRETAAEKREDCRDALFTIQTLLRERLTATDKPSSLSKILARTMEGEMFLASNVDPRLVCEYILLNSPLNSPPFSPCGGSPVGGQGGARGGSNS